MRSFLLFQNLRQHGRVKRWLFLIAAVYGRASGTWPRTEVTFKGRFCDLANYKIKVW